MNIFQQDVSLDELTEEVLNGMDEYLKANSDMYVSTRCCKSLTSTSLGVRCSLGEAILGGLAHDGGLYIPMRPLPKLTSGCLKRLYPLWYKHKAHIVLEKLIHHSQVSPCSFINGG